MKILRVIPIVALAAFILAACAGPAPVGPTTALPKLDLAKELSDIRAYYNSRYQAQNDLVILGRKYQQTRSNYDLTVNDMVANNAICYKNVAGTESEIAHATFDMSKDRGSLINALVSQTINGEQATTVCAQNNQKIADFVVSGRQAVLDSYNQMFEAASDFKKSLADYPEIKVMNDLFQTYGDPTLVEQKLKDYGIPGFTDFVWLPTEDLFWDMPGNKAMCDYFQSGAFEANLLPSLKNKFYGHEDSLRRLYEAQWQPQVGANGNCRLYRQAALDQMTEPILSAATQNVINTGTDTGAIPTPQP